RPVASYVKPPGGNPGALSYTKYDGFTNLSDRHIDNKVFTDPVSFDPETLLNDPSPLENATGHAATVHLDELARERITDAVAGTDYPGIAIEAGHRPSDSFGRVVFEADPYPSNQDRTTAYGTTKVFNTDGTLAWSVRGNGRQQNIVATSIVTTNEGSEIYP